VDDGAVIVAIVHVIEKIGYRVGRHLRIECHAELTQIGFCTNIILCVGGGAGQGGNQGQEQGGR